MFNLKEWNKQANIIGDILAKAPNFDKNARVGELEFKERAARVYNALKVNGFDGGIVYSDEHYHDRSHLAFPSLYSANSFLMRSMAKNIAAREATGAEIYTQFAGIGIVTADFPTLRRQYCVPDTKRTAKIAMIISRIATLRISLPFPLKLPVNTSITRWLFSLTAIAAPRNMSHTKFILTSSSVHDTGILNTNLQRTWMNVTATRRETKTIRRKLITFVMNAETFSTFTSLERESPPSQITIARFSSRSG